MGVYEPDPAVALLLKEYQCDRLFGSLEVKFEEGRVVLIKRSETIKPMNNNRNNRTGDDEQ